MPSVLTYPGVYIEEVPSGVRTISGVGTSITAFVGYTAMGPLNSAVRILSFADYERAFGGLSRDSDVSYAVQQYFLNGGSDAYVVRVAAGAAAASVIMKHAGGNALVASAVNAGAWGNYVRLDVDWATGNPDSTFNLGVARIDPGTLSVVDREQFLNLSMSSRSSNYAVNVVNAGSRMVRLARGAGLAFADQGFSMSGDLTGVTLAAGTYKLQGVLNGGSPFSLTLAPATDADTVAKIRTALNTAISNAGLTDKLETLRVDAAGGSNSSGSFIAIRAKAVGGDDSTLPEYQSVAITPAATADASGTLKFGLAGGGREFEGAASRRPLPTGTSADVSSIMGTNVSGDASISIINNTASGTDTILAPTTVTLASTAVGPLLPPALQTLIRTIDNAVAKQVAVQLAGDRLRLVLPEAYAGATIVVGGALGTALGMPAGSEPATNVQRYALGVGVTVGAQGAGAVGADGSPPGGTDYIGSEVSKTGMYALLDTDLFTLMCIPGTPRLSDTAASAVIQEAIALCERRRAFYIIDPPANQTLQTVGAWAGDLTASMNSAVYYPRIVAADALDGFRPREMPSSGAVAGVYARTDSQRGIWKAPAGTDATIRGTQALAYNLTDLECGLLNPLGVNCLRSFPVYGRVVWGARTRKGANQEANAEYRYVPVRRLASYIEESLYRGTQWVVFEPNDEPLWAQIRLNVGAFMNNLFRQGAFQGKSPAQAYLVKCDSDTTTQNDIDLGVVNILVAFAPLKPAEFVVIRLQQKAGQIAA
jgi:phage tail sheath protein FI